MTRSPATAKSFTQIHICVYTKHHHFPSHSVVASDKFDCYTKARIIKPAQCPFLFALSLFARVYSPETTCSVWSVALTLATHIPPNALNYATAYAAINAASHLPSFSSYLPTLRPCTGWHPMGTLNRSGHVWVLGICKEDTTKKYVFGVV